MIDHTVFIGELEYEISNDAEVNKEIRKYGKQLIADSKKLMAEHVNAVAAGVVIMSRRILQHGYGEIIAKRFRDWIWNNYVPTEEGWLPKSMYQEAV